MNTSKKIPAFNPWQIALLSIIVTSLGKLSGGSSKNNTKIYTKKFKQAPWAPPAWIFAPAWILNNYFLLNALIKILKDDNLDEKQSLLGLQAIIWLIFFSL